MKKGNEYIFDVQDTEFPGYGIAEYDGLKVYIKNAVPGQKVLGTVSKKRKSYAEAKIKEIIEDINYRIEEKCPHFDFCGGCTHQFISVERQMELKKQQVLKLFEKASIGGFKFSGIESSPEEFEYRNKMEFTFGDFEKGGELCLGMHVKGKSFGIVTVDNCQIVDGDFRLILSTVLNYFRGKGLPHYKIMAHEGYLRNLVIRKAKNTGEILVSIVTTSQIEFNYKELTDILMGIKYEGILTSLLHIVNDSFSDVVQADSIEVLYGRDYIIEELMGLKFKISPFSFFQTNSKGAEKLYGIVKEFMGDSSSKVVFDLYCGTGTIGQIAATSAKKVIGIELIEEAVKAANENAAFNGLTNCHFIPGDIAKVITEVKEKPDVIILDPPRPGVHRVALDYVLKFDVKDLIYVSCNPKSLVEDLKVILADGYVIDEVRLMDMFPHTPHIETVVKLHKENQWVSVI